MKCYTTKSSCNCGPCSFINLTEAKGTKKLEKELEKLKLKPYKASGYSSFLAWSKNYGKDLTVYTDFKTLNKKMFDLMNTYEKVPEALHEEFRKESLKRFKKRIDDNSDKIKRLGDPIKKLNSLLKKGHRVAILNSNFYFNNGESVPHWVVAYNKDGKKYSILCSRKGDIVLSERDLLKGFKLNKKIGYLPVLVAYKK